MSKLGWLHWATWGSIGMGYLGACVCTVAPPPPALSLPPSVCCPGPGHGTLTPLPPALSLPSLSLLPWAWPWYPYPSPPCPLSSPPQSAALGLAMAGAIALGYANIFVTAPSPENLKTLFEFVTKVRRGTGGRWGRRKVGWCKIGCVWPMWPSRWSVCGQCGLQDGACEANVAYSV